MNKRRFGRVRKLPSGRYQARYLGPDTVDRPAPQTFATKTDAERWLALIESEIIRRQWVNPDQAKTRLGTYLPAWIDQRAGLRPRTVDLYRWLYTKHIAPALQGQPLAEITPVTIRAWRTRLIDQGVSEGMVAKAYRLLRAVLNTAVEDELIRRNPCRIKGGGQERPAERPVATVEQVYAIADRVHARFRVLVLVAAFTSLRYGELAALRREDINTRAGTVRVRATLVERQDGSVSFGPPKTAAGKRAVTVPEAIRADLRQHLAEYVGPAPDALVFSGVTGAALRRSNFQRTSRWTETVTAAGLPGFHFHDLRHTGNNLAAATGASLRDLMHRMGHQSTRAALIYQHATEQRDREIAAGLSDQIERARGSGTQRARRASASTDMKKAQDPDGS
jgi:integrase